jgi:hypothetical protein
MPGEKAGDTSLSRTETVHNNTAETSIWINPEKLLNSDIFLIARTVSLFEMPWTCHK